ncbi:MAG: SIS domain-containing protein [Gammaproteobacteria bacterium]|nr:SIS domain-containing protein [Gammaproteobacteria bacterium]MBQ0838253.1 SIS domain-containing protein [Gammaproteobacteria bacterium]
MNSDPEQQVIELFHRSIEAKMTVGEELAGPLTVAAQRLVAHFLQGNKVLTCGEGLSNAAAATLTRCLTHGYIMERPGFPALTLLGEAAPGDLNDLAATASPYQQPITALAMDGDVLVVFSAGHASVNLLGAIAAAKSRALPVIAFTANGDQALSHLLDDNDIELHVAIDDQYRIQEIHQLCVFCLCELIENHLFGEQT